MAETYIGRIIREVNAVTNRCGPVLLYGENIDKGSRISGLARGLEVNPAGRILNVGNCELTHCGLGFGIALDGGNAALFVKQLDFMLLGLDQIVNTYNFIRAFRAPESVGSFTIFVIVCDQGYQGPQSSLNGAGDFASLANVNVFCLNGADDAASVVDRHFVRPGFRMICVSQRQFPLQPLTLPVQSSTDDDAIFHYRRGDDVTLVSFNFALRHAVDVAERLAAGGVGADLLHVNFVPSLDPTPLIESARRTKRIVLLDDSKSVTKFSDALVAQLSGMRADVSVLSLVRRGCPDPRYGVDEDQFTVDHGQVLAFVRQG